MNGIRIRFETKPGKSRASAGSLPRSRASSTIAAAVSSEVWTARITSTSFSTGTGLKKCMPITRSGRAVTAASEVIGIELVFDARIAPSGRTPSARRKSSSFAAASSLIASIIRSAGTRSVDRLDARRASRPDVARRACQALPHRREPSLDRARERVVQGDAAPRRGDDLRDAAPHLARADDENMLDLHGGAAYPSRRGGPESNGRTTRTRSRRFASQAGSTAYRHVFPANELDAMPVDSSRWAVRLDDAAAGLDDLRRRRATATVLGFASVGPSRDERGIGELYALYVDPEHWSTGAGRALMTRAEARLVTEYAEATLWVLEDNPRARRFYERAGWTRRRRA